MKYGQLPKVLGIHSVECTEMMFYQYLPIKLAGQTKPVYEDRLRCFDKLIGTICCDFIGVFGLDAYTASNIYLTAKYMFQPVGCSYNRPGWHSDGFMTEDINYIWSDCFPTVFNNSDFNLSMDDRLSLDEMDIQALEKWNVYYENCSLFRLNQFNIHRTQNVTQSRMRTFLKVSFSKDRYDLKGNAHNYLLDYDWEMKERKMGRNIPQSVPTQKDLIS